MKVHLQVTDGPDRGRTFTFEERDRFLIGRAPTAHFQLSQDGYFSRHHAMLDIAPPNVMLSDLQSTNGTFVNDRRVEAPVALQHGDTISGGTTRIQIVVEQNEQPAVAPTINAADIGSEATQPPSGLDVSSFLGGGGASAGKVAVRCLKCGAKAPNELPRSRAENMAYFCDSCHGLLMHEPKLLPDYQVVKELGRGGMGAVYLAVHPVLGKRAIKMILPRAAMSRRVRDMFLREASTQAALDHPRIVRVTDFKETAPGIFCIVMEFVDGKSADALVEGSPGGIDPRLAVQIIAQALEGLGYAHARGIVHRDIKDANLLVSRDASGELAVKLTDFGLAKSYESSGASGITRTGEIAGTIAYMPPEQILNYRDVRPSADIYSMGATLYQLVTGGTPYDFRADVDPFVTILEAPLVPVRSRNPSVAEPLATAIERALDKNPEQRFTDAEAMRSAILSAIS